MGAENTTPYLSPSLREEGYTGATGTTPYKPVSPEGVQALQNLHHQPPLQGVKPLITPTSHVINVNFDGTQNNGWFPAPGESPTNVFLLSKIQEKAFGEQNTLYYPGVGAPKGTPGAPKPDVPASNLDSINLNAGPIAIEIVDRAFRDLSRRVTQIHQQDPNAPISINLSGFSRGAAQAVALANLIDQRGLPGVYEPGQSKVDSMLLYDPVDMTGGALNTRWPGNVQNNLVLVAQGESRHIMPAMPLGPGAKVVGVPEAAHADTGGSFNPQGIQAVTLGVGLRFQQAVGMALPEAPAHLQPDWNQMRSHDSSRDNYGHQRWSTHGGNRYYEGAGRSAPSVHDVIEQGATAPARGGPPAAAARTTETPSAEPPPPSTEPPDAGHHRAPDPHAQRFTEQLGGRLQQLGMSKPQIETLAAAAAKEATRHAGQGEVSEFLLSKDACRVALRQEYPPLREFNLVQALGQSAAAHEQESRALAAEQSPQRQPGDTPMYAVLPTFASPTTASPAHGARAV